MLGHWLPCRKAGLSMQASIVTRIWLHVRMHVDTHRKWPRYGVDISALLEESWWMLGLHEADLGNGSFGRGRFYLDALKCCIASSRNHLDLVSR